MDIKNFSGGKFRVEVFVKTSYPDTIFNKGKEKYDAKKFDEALVYFDKELEKNPKNYMAFFFRGQCYLNKNNIQNAYENYAVRFLNENIGRGILTWMSF